MKFKIWTFFFRKKLPKKSLKNILLDIQFSQTNFYEKKKEETQMKIFRLWNLSSCFYLKNRLQRTVVYFCVFAFLFRKKLLWKIVSSKTHFKMFSSFVRVSSTLFFKFDSKDSGCWLKKNKKKDIARIKK